MDNSSPIKKKFRIIIAATGSVASIKLAELIKILKEKAEIKVVLTQSSKKFISTEELKQLKVDIYEDKDENQYWKKRGDPVLHVQLRKWADAMLIAPLSAHTLAKIANGFSDSLVTLIARCWNMKTRKLHEKDNNSIKNGEEIKKLVNPLVVCPAMNTMMWEHPVTEEHLSKLKNWGLTVVDPIQKVLMCGDSGKGAMANLDSIVQTLLKELANLESNPQ